VPETGARDRATTPVEAVVVAPASAPAPSSTAIRERFRPDIQALRALAVVLVVANHLWPLRFTGGYVGVDVFFVISGYLITLHLVRELHATGRVRFATFYARRARRLLPTALLVLAVSTVATWLLLPPIDWLRSALEIVASAFYVENWTLAGFAVDYSAQNDAATVAQHYWSLSVEEQFYLVWPIALVLVWVAATRVARSHRRMLAGALVAIGAASFGASIWITAVSQQSAYFVTPTRAWEFAAGALVALAGHRILLRRAWAEVASIAGFGAIAASALLFDANTPFPGAAALLPVAGAVLVIVAGSGQSRLAHDLVTSRRPIQWVGDVSYSIYLWHWPLVVLAPFLLSRSLTSLDKLALVAVTLLLAGLTRRFVETPGIRSAWLGASARRTMMAAAGGMAAIALLGGGLVVAHATAPAMSGAVPIAAPTPRPCEGPAAVADGAGCADPFAVPASDPNMGARNVYYNVPPDCRADPALLSVDGTPTTVHCTFGEAGDDAPVAWLIGDSHAQQWQWPVFDMARARGWNLTISYLGGCPVADVSFVGYRGATDPFVAETCMTWAADAAAEVERSGADVVFTSSFSREQAVDDGSGRDAQTQLAEGFSAYWDRWTAAGATVVVLGDPPLNGSVRDPDCVALHPSDPLRCAVPRDVAQPADPMLLAAQASTNERVIAFDVTPYSCDERSCYAVVGGVPVYFDSDHLNLEYARLMRPALEAALDDGAGR